MRDRVTAGISKRSWCIGASIGRKLISIWGH